MTPDGPRPRTVPDRGEPESNHRSTDLRDTSAGLLQSDESQILLEQPGQRIPQPGVCAGAWLVEVSQRDVLDEIPPARVDTASASSVAPSSMLTVKFTGVSPRSRQICADASSR